MEIKLNQIWEIEGHKGTVIKIDGNIVTLDCGHRKGERDGDYLLEYGRLVADVEDGDE